MELFKNYKALYEKEEMIFKPLPTNPITDNQKTYAGFKEIFRKATRMLQFHV